jgi:FixJ family two-component response regulator
MNGIELVKQLEERGLHYPVILITSGTAHGVPRVAAHPDIQDVLEKPLQDDALIDRIHRALAASACASTPRAYADPKLSTHRRIVSYETTSPRSAKSSSTSR